ncbi:MAG: helix-turn-helix domain-containing protein [Cyanobacteria bacterium P01_G01_bin.67]
MKNRLKELRKTFDWSQADLARALNISRQAVNGFESGKFTPSLEMAFKIGLLFDVAIESVFSYQEKSPMQNLREKVSNFSQWLPKGERFTDEAIATIEFAQHSAGLSGKSQVEPRDILKGLMQNVTTPVARLLAESGLTPNREDSKFVARHRALKVNKFSPESRYVLELALNAARLKQKKYIDTEQLLLGLMQLMQLGNDELTKIFQNNEIDISALTDKVRELQ